MKIKLEIDDDCKEKMIELKILLISMAMERFNDDVCAARWMGISIKNIRMWMNKYKELHKYKLDRKEIGNEKWSRYPDN